MKALALDPSTVKFPARCAGCGASPSHDVTIESFRGIDVLYVRWGHRCEVPLPMCRACWAKRWRRRVAWFVGMISTIVALIAGTAGVAALFGDDDMGPVIMGALVLVLLPLIFFLRAREQELFQRIASPVWLRGWTPKQNRVELCFRDQKLADEVAILSGLVAPPQREAHYREAAVAPQAPAWGGPKPRQIPWWVALIISGAFFAVAVGEFIQYSDFEQTGHSFSDEALFVWIYELGGKYALCGILVFFGMFFLIGGFVLRKLLRNRGTGSPL